MSLRLLLTVVEAAVLGIGRSTMYELLRAGEVEVFHLWRCARVPATALEEFVELQRGSKPLDTASEVAS